MIYIQRDQNQKIIDIQFQQTEGFEEIGLFEPELKSFLENSKNEMLIKTVLEKLDLDMVRVIEDMVDLMIDKELILFTDLPSPVQNKLLFKRSIRQSLGDHHSHLIDEEVLNF